jgi:hypothetical protein
MFSSQWPAALEVLPLEIRRAIRVGDLSVVIVMGAIEPTVTQTHVRHDVRHGVGIEFGRWGGRDDKRVILIDVGALDKATVPECCKFFNRLPKPVVPQFCFSKVKETMFVAVNDKSGYKRAAEEDASTSASESKLRAIGILKRPKYSKVDRLTDGPTGSKSWETQQLETQQLRNERAEQESRRAEERLREADTFQRVEQERRRAEEKEGATEEESRRRQRAMVGVAEAEKHQRESEAKRKRDEDERSRHGAIQTAPLHRQGDRESLRVDLGRQYRERVCEERFKELVVTKKASANRFPTQKSERSLTAYHQMEEFEQRRKREAAEDIARKSTGFSFMPRLRSRCFSFAKRPPWK